MMDGADGGLEQIRWQYRVLDGCGVVSRGTAYYVI